ncbi:MAG: hypothetical protein MNPFHGCM_03174 [Gemmatimonadaceae bacterium]|nr:hypothetical protein [Gemmatimonadaceae bacterium]
MRILLAGWHAADRETDAAEKWLAQHGFVARRALASAVSGADAGWADAMWCHGAALASEPPSEAFCERVAAGGALLTLRGCQFLTSCGIESRPPIESQGTWHHRDDPLWDEAFRDWPHYPHIRGVQGWATGAHPLFEGFQRGTFSRRFAEGEPFTELGYDWPDWPTGRNARVVAVERAYVQLRSHRAVVWEYPIGGRRLLCIGAHVALTGVDALLDRQRDRLLGNALGLVARSSPPAEAEACWPRRDAPAEPWLVLPVGVPAIPSDRPVEEPQARGDAADAPFTIAGRGALVTGTERSGIQDIWLHPLCVVSGGLAARLEDESLYAARIEVAPTGIRRLLCAGDEAGRPGSRTVVERIVPALRDPMLLLTYEDTMATGEFELQFQAPLRLQWPYDADALHPLSVVCWGHDTGRHVVAISGADDRSTALIMATGASSASCIISDGVPTVTIGCDRGANVRLLFAAGTDGVGALRARVAARVAEEPDLVTERRRHYAALRRRTVRSSSPDAVLDAGLLWATHRLDMFLANTPDGALGLMAGYATSRAGWAVSRPGYAWFFGRDACWCAEAMLAIGLFDEVRDVLRHLASSRDISGKVIHELTTSGVAHYDAADATPLFLRLVGLYWQWTSDVNTVRELWDAVRESMNFVMSTDRDGDGLPENVDVGHGWVESGPLGGGAVTSYVASIWIDALRRLLPLAESLGDLRSATSWRTVFDRARHSFEDRLRDPSDGSVALQLRSDGKRQLDLTALGAVPIALGVDCAASADDVLEALTGPEFAAPWGMRLIGQHDRRYDPRGYQAGAVWPLFTGWTALACYARGHSAAGLRLVRGNTSLWMQRAKGAFDEVLNGDTGDAAGVCPDQAWSAAMAIAPFVSGAWGIQPNAPSRELRVSLQLPEDWEAASLDGVRIGSATVDFRVRRERRAGSCVESLSFLARDFASSLDRVSVEVLAATTDAVALTVERGTLQTRTTRQCRPGLVWLGVTVSVGDGEGRIEVNRTAGP